MPPREEDYYGAVIGKMRKAEVELSRSKKVPEMCWKSGVQDNIS